MQGKMGKSVLQGAAQRRTARPAAQQQAGDLGKPAQRFPRFHDKPLGFHHARLAPLDGVRAGNDRQAALGPARINGKHGFRWERRGVR